MSQATILVAENDADLREALAVTLEHASYTVLTAENGKEGLSLAQEHHPDLILLDVVMPHMTGHEMIEKLRGDPWGKDAKVVMLTSMSSAADITHAVEHDSKDYIIKSHASLEEIVNKVREALHS